MEMPFNLIWVIRPLTECLLTGGAIRPREAELALVGPFVQPFRVELGYCEDSGCWYGLFDGLERMLDEAGWDSDQITAFHVHGREVTVGGWLGEETGILPWEKLIALLREMVSERTGPPPDAAEVRALPELAETWEVGVRVARWISEDEGRPVLSYVAAVLDGELVLRQFNLKTGTRHDADELATLLLEAAIHPRAPARPGRPHRVLLDDRTLAETLAAPLAGAGIAVEAAATPQVGAILDSMMDEMRQEEHPSYFTAYDAEEVRAFFRTATPFYRARPWERFDGTKYLGFRIGTGAWQYANVMGQAGEEPGLSIFDDWLQLCRFVHNQPEYAPLRHRDDRLWPLRAAGALEGLTLSPLHFLHPDDADLILRLGARPLRRGEYPLPHRYVAGGLDRPRLAIRDYRMLMQALQEVLAARRAFAVTTLRRTVDVDGTPVRLVFPANAREEFEDGAGAFRLVVEGAKSTSKNDPLPPGARVEVDAPGDARIDDVAHAIKREGGEGLRVDGFFDGDFCLWLNTVGRLAATPRVAHLAAVRDPVIACLGNRYRLRVTRRSGTAPEAIEVRVVR